MYYVAKICIHHLLGIYIYMSVHVIRLLLLFFLVYSTTLLAFAFAFHLLLPSNPNFDNPFTSLLKVRWPLLVSAIHS